LSARYARGRRRSGRRRREREGFGEHFFPAGEGIGEFELLFDAGERVKEELAEVGEDGGVAARNAILSDGGEKFAEDEVDVSGSKEIAGESTGDFRAELMGFAELLFGAGVEGAERRMIAAKHAAAASVGELELAQGRVGAGGAFCGHGSLRE